MALFTKNDPLITANTARDKLRMRLADAEAAVMTATVTANALALDDASDSDLTKAESDVRDRVHRVSTLNAALVESDAMVKELETARDDAADLAQRKETVILNHRLKDEFVKEADVLKASAARMSDIAERVALMVPEANGIKNISDVLITQLPEAVALLCREIDNNSAAVLRRELAAKGKQLPVVIAPVAMVQPVRMSVFATRSFKFTDPDSGKLVVTKQFRDVEMPPTFAKVALDLKLCVRISDPIRMKNNNTVAGHAEPLHAFDLDEAMTIRVAGPQLVEPIRQSAPTPQFVETIGQPKRVSMS